MDAKFENVKPPALVLEDMMSLKPPPIPRTTWAFVDPKMAVHDPPPDPTTGTPVKFPLKVIMDDPGFNPFALLFLKSPEIITELLFVVRVPVPLKERFPRMRRAS